MIGVGDIFKVGIGPSSSHTIGPMKAAALFMAGLGDSLARVARLRATAFGSLAWTGKGHATDKALILGLAGCMPASLDPDGAEDLFARIRREARLDLADGRTIAFDPDADIVFNCVDTFERHPNAMFFEAFDAEGRPGSRSGAASWCETANRRVRVNPPHPCPIPSARPRTSSISARVPA